MLLLYFYETIKIVDMHTFYLHRFWDILMRPIVRIVPSIRLCLGPIGWNMYLNDWKNIAKIEKLQNLAKLNYGKPNNFFWGGG